MAVYGIDYYGSEYYGLPKFSDFDANPFVVEPLDYGALRLTWATPAGDWDILRVVRNSYGAPDWEDDGTVVAEYAEPTTNEIFDENLSGGRFYYYAVFVRETANQRWHRAATALGLTTGDHGHSDSFFNWLPGWFREQDNDLAKADNRHGDGPLKKYLKVTGLAADFVRTEYESLRWTRDPDRISGNLLPMLAQQFGVPNEPALGMRRTRFWVRDAVFLYRRKGTLPGIQAIVTTITGWDSQVGYDRNLLKGVDAAAWSATTGTIADDVASSDLTVGDLVTDVTAVGGAWSITNVPATATGDAVTYHAIPIDGGRLYAATAEFLAATTGSVTPSIDWYDATGAFLSSGSGDVIDPAAGGTAWTGAYVAAISPANAAYAAIRFDGTVTTKFRRASLEADHDEPGWTPPMSLDIALVPARTNYVTNPSFETDIRSWNYSGDGEWGITPVQYYSGLQSLEATGRYEPATLTGGPYRIDTADAWHVFSTYFRGQDVTGEVRVKWWNEAGIVVRTSPWSQVFQGSGTGWTRAWLSDFAPADAVSASVELQLNPPPFGTRDPDGLAFDGTAGSYATVPDTNLLDTVQASFDNVPFAGTVTPEDRYEIWGSGGGTGAGAPGAASPMLIDLEKLKTDDRHLFLPGKAGNYGSIPDVNIINAGVDRAERSGGEAIVGSAGTRSFNQTPPSLPSVSPAVTKAVQHTRGNATGYEGFYFHQAPRVNVTAGTTYTFSAYALRATNVSASVRIEVQWYDGAGAAIATHGAWFAAAASTTDWVRGAVTAAAPAGAVSCRLVLFTGGGASGDVTWYTAFQMEAAGAASAFVPSTRIVGDLDVRVDSAWPDWTPSPAKTLTSKYNDPSQRSWSFYVGTDGRLNLVLTTDGSTGVVAASTVAPTVSNGTRVALRATWRQSDGRVQFFQAPSSGGAWTQVGTDVTLTLASIYAGPAPIRIGAYHATSDVEGRFYAVETRDGIDGPVVASYDFANAERGQTALTTPEGHALTINQSNVIGSGRAEIRGGTPKKAGWLPGAAGNYFSVPDTNLLSNKQSVFSGIPTGTALTPNQTEVWGTGGGTAAGAPGAASPMLIDLVGYGVDRALWLPGAAGNYVSAPDNPALDITGDIDIRAYVALKDWSPGDWVNLVSKRGRADSVDAAYQMIVTGPASAVGIGRLQIDWWQPDGAVKTATSTVTIPAADRSPLHLRATLDVDNGAGAYEVKFYTSTDGVTWTQLGTTITGTATTSIRSTTSIVEVGSRATGSEDYITGVVLRTQIRDGIDGPIVYDEDFSAARWAGNPSKATHPAILPAKHTTFTRSSTAHLDGVEVAAGTPRYTGAYRDTVLAKNPVGYWRLGEVLGATAVADHSGNSNHGTVEGAPTFGTAGALTRDRDTAATFDGVDDAVAIADSASFDVTSFTIEAWIKTSNAGTGRRRIWSQQTAVGTYWLMALFDNKLELGSSADGLLTTRGVALNDNAWHHVVVVRDAVNDVARWYVDGVEVGTATATGGSYALSATPYIGRYYASASEHFAGAIDEVAVYNRALTADEVDENHRAGLDPATVGGILIEEGTTNLLTANQASLETDTTGWAAQYGGTVARSTTRAWHGAASLALTRTGGTTGTMAAWTSQGTAGTPVSASTAYTAQVRVFSPAARTVNLEFLWYDAAGALITGQPSTSVTSVASAWARLTLTATSPASAAFAAIRVTVVDALDAEVHYFDGAQVEAKGYATSWHPGGATRNEDVLTLTVATHGLAQSAGSVEVDINVTQSLLDKWATGADARLVGITRSGMIQSALTIWRSGTNLVYYVTDAAGNVGQVAEPLSNITAGIHRFVVTWNGSALAAYRNGAQVGTATTISTSGLDALGTMWVGAGINNTLWSNTPTLGIRLSRHARTAAELADWTALLTADEGTTYLNTFDGDLEGQWGATSTINRSGDATAEIVERNTWAFTGTEWLDIPDRDIVDFPLSSNWSQAASFATRMLNAKFFGKREPSSLPFYGLHINNGAGHGEVRDSAGTLRSVVTPGTVSDGAWHLVQAGRNGDTVSVRRNGDAPAFVTAAWSGTFENASALEIGRWQTASYFKGLGGWFALMRRALTVAEQDELVAWDGSVATEPKWLRSAAVFYVNAADPAVVSAYANNEVVNLAAKPSNVFGWNAWKHGNGHADGLFNVESRTSLSTATPQFGSHLLGGSVGDVTAATFGTFRTNPVGPVTSGQTYTGSFDLWTDTALASVNIALVWIDSAGGEVGRTAEVLTGNGTTSTWRRVSVAGAAPASAVSVSIYVRTSATGRYYAFDRVTIRQGTATDFVPTHRITGDLDLRAKVALKDWTPGTNQTFLGKWATGGNSSAWVMRLETTGTIGLFVNGPFGSGRFSTVAVPAGDRAPKHIRATVDVDNGAGSYELKFWVSDDGVTWTQLGTTLSGASAAIATGDSHVTFGAYGSNAATAPSVGVFQEAEVRDGIDGPIVARFDADDPAGLPAGAANGASYTDVTTGHSVVLNASGMAQTEVVERALWASVGLESLVLPHRSEFALPASTTLSGYARAAVPTTNEYRFFIDKKGTSLAGSATGWALIQHSNVDRINFQVSDGASSPSSVFSGAVLPLRGWKTHGFLITPTDIRSISEGSDGPVVARPAGSFDDPNDPVRLGGNGVLNQWWALFRRDLTTAERATLAAWDGKVATEPVWLRPLAVFYTNADDPLVRQSYANNEVLNLGSAPYGDLGWVPDNDVTIIDRSSVATPVVGSMTLRLTSTVNDGTTKTLAIRTPEGPAAPTVDGSQPISASCSVYRPQTYGITMRLIFLDSAGGELGRTSNTTPSVASAWTRASVTEAAPPAGTARIAVQVELPSMHSAWTGYMDAVTIRQGADTGYVPSLRVRHDLDLRVRAALDDWTPAANNVLLAKDTGVNFFLPAYALWVNSAGGLALRARSSGVNYTYASTTPVTAEDGDQKHLRAIYNGSTGDVTFYTADVGASEAQLGSVVNNAARRLDTGSGNLDLGRWPDNSSPLIGAIYTIEVRDGISGPILFSADFTTAPWVEQDTAPTTKDDVTLVGPGVHIQSAIFSALMDAAMLEEGDFPGEYFDGSRFGADYIWGGNAHMSTSRHYPGRTARTARLREILPDWLPLGQQFNLRFTEEAEVGARNAGYGALGVGGTGRMNFGE